MSNQQLQSDQIDTDDKRSHLFKPGNTGWHGRTSPQTRYVRKLQLAMDKAVDKLGKRMQTDGADACAELICNALQEDIVGTLHRLAFFMPKNINVDVQITKDFKELSDAELEAIIAERRAIAVHKDAALIEHVPSQTDSINHDDLIVQIVDNDGT